MENNVDSELSIKKARRIAEKLAVIKKFLANYHNQTLNSTGRMETIKGALYDAEAFLAIMSNREENYKMIAGINILTNIDTSNSIVSLFLEGVHMVIDRLELKLKPQLSINEKQRLTGFRDDLAKLIDESLDEVISRDLEKSISELEIPNYLSSSMVAARATIYMVDKIKGDGENKDEDKVNKLQTMGIIDRGEMSRTTSKYFLEASRSSRNLLLHKIGFIPTHSDASGYLAYSIKMARLYIKYAKEISKKN